jgi:hypothetical protein
MLLQASQLNALAPAFVPHNAPGGEVDNRGNLPPYAMTPDDQRWFAAEYEKRMPKNSTLVDNWGIYDTWRDVKKLAHSTIEAAPAVLQARKEL